MTGLGIKSIPDKDPGGEFVLGSLVLVRALGRQDNLLQGYIIFQGYVKFPTT